MTDVALETKEEYLTIVKNIKEACAYNDMLNDNTYPYWCIRNKVEKPKIFNKNAKKPPQMR